MLPGQRLLSARARRPAAFQRRGRRGTDAEGQAGRAAGGAAPPAPPGCTVRSTHGAEEEKEEEEGEREGSRRRKAGKPALRGTAANFPPAAGAASHPLVCIPPRGGGGVGGGGEGCVRQNPLCPSSILLPGPSSQLGVSAAPHQPELSTSPGAPASFAAALWRQAALHTLPCRRGTPALFSLATTAITELDTPAPQGNGKAPAGLKNFILFVRFIFWHSDKHTGLHAAALRGCPLLP